MSSCGGVAARFRCEAAAWIKRIGVVRAHPLQGGNKRRQTGMYAPPGLSACQAKQIPVWEPLSSHIVADCRADLL